MATTALRTSVPRVLDKYMLPKVAFTVITFASMAGAALTGLRHGLLEWHLLALRWAAFWTLALLLGSEVWKIWYLRPSIRLRPVLEAVQYGEAMIRIHRTWQRVLIPTAGLLAGVNLWTYAARFEAALPWAAAGAAALVAAAAGAALTWRTDANTQHTGAVEYLALVGLAGAVATIAGLDVALQAGTTTATTLLAINRSLHLWAFSAWLGGALWNIFIAVPAGLQRINMDTVILANFQLERFRVVVRAVFPTIVVTGLVQSWAMFGWQWQALFSSLWGWLVLSKLGLILVLVAVFITCPMWKACSPIRGVCDLDDL